MPESSRRWCLYGVYKNGTGAKSRDFVHSLKRKKSRVPGWQDAVRAKLIITHFVHSADLTQLRVACFSRCLHGVRASLPSRDRGWGKISHAHVSDTICSCLLLPLDGRLEPAFPPAFSFLMQEGIASDAGDVLCPPRPACLLLFIVLAHASPAHGVFLVFHLPHGLGGFCFSRVYRFEDPPPRLPQRI